jgi:hypothetical protein
MCSQHVNQMLDRILGSDIAEYRGEHGQDYDRMADKSSAHITREKSDRTFRRVAWQRHDGIAHLETRVALFLVNHSVGPDG